MVNFGRLFVNQSYGGLPQGSTRQKLGHPVCKETKWLFVEQWITYVKDSLLNNLIFAASIKSYFELSYGNIPQRMRFPANIEKMREVA